MPQEVSALPLNENGVPDVINYIPVYKEPLKIYIDILEQITLDPDDKEWLTSDPVLNFLKTCGFSEYIPPANSES